MKLHKDEGYVTKNFLTSFKENFKQSTIIWLIYLIVGALIVLNLFFWKEHGRENKLILGFLGAITIFCGISLSYVFAIQAKFVNPVINTLRYSVLLPFNNLKETILILVTLSAVIYFNVTTIFMVNFFTLNVGVGFIAFLLATFYNVVFDRYIPREEISDSWKMADISEGNEEKAEN